MHWEKANKIEEKNFALVTKVFLQSAVFDKFDKDIFAERVYQKEKSHTDLVNQHILERNKPC